MSDKLNDERAADGVADSIATVVVISIVVLATCVWLAGVPS